MYGHGRKTRSWLDRTTGHWPERTMTFPMSAAPWLLLQGQHILELLDSEDDLLDFNALVRRQKTVNYFPLLFKISMLNALTQRRLM